MEVIELTTSVKYNIEKGYTRTNKILSEMMFQSPYCMKLEQASGTPREDARYTIPRCLYDFNIGLLGETSFTPSLMRSYAVKVDVQISVKGNRINLLKYVDLKVAVTFDFFNRLTFKVARKMDKVWNLFPKKSKQPSNTTYSIKCVPKDVYRSKPSTWNNWDAERSLLWYETAMAFKDEFILVVSAFHTTPPLDLPLVKVDMRKVCDTYGINSFDSWPKIYHEICFLICEVV